MSFEFLKIPEFKKTVDPGSGDVVNYKQQQVEALNPVKVPVGTEIVAKDVREAATELVTRSREALDIIVKDDLAQEYYQKLNDSHWSVASLYDNPKSRPSLTINRAEIKVLARRVYVESQTESAPFFSRLFDYITHGEAIQYVLDKTFLACTVNTPESTFALNLLRQGLEHRTGIIQGLLGLPSARQMGVDYLLSVAGNDVSRNKLKKTLKSFESLKKINLSTLWESVQSSWGKIDTGPLTQAIGGTLQATMFLATSNTWRDVWGYAESITGLTGVSETKYRIERELENQFAKMESYLAGIHTKNRDAAEADVLALKNLTSRMHTNDSIKGYDLEIPQTPGNLA